MVLICLIVVLMVLTAAVACLWRRQRGMCRKIELTCEALAILQGHTRLNNNQIERIGQDRRDSCEVLQKVQTVLETLTTPARE